jgi:hypothetical protein
MTAWQMPRTCEPHQSFSPVALHAFAARPIKELAVPGLHQRGFVAVRRTVKGGLRFNFSAISTSRRSASEREELSGWRFATRNNKKIDAHPAMHTRVRSTSFSAL